VKKGIIAGSFDLIHPGYIRMFKEAKEICDFLIVALQDDPTIDRPQKMKPVNTWKEREEVLSSIKYIDKIVYYNTESDLTYLMHTMQYDVRILGEDYKDTVGSFLFEKPIFFCKRNHDYSSTNLKRMIAKSVIEYDSQRGNS
jgi:glycerol-3-phosphate cytidylyltransferase